MVKHITRKVLEVVRILCLVFVSIQILTNKTGQLLILPPEMRFIKAQRFFFTNYFNCICQLLFIVVYPETWMGPNSPQCKGYPNNIDLIGKQFGCQKFLILTGHPKQLLTRFAFVTNIFALFQ